MTTPRSPSCRILPLPALLLAAVAAAQQPAWSTLLGGSGRDAAHAVAVDERGFVTVAGWTASANWPYGTVGAGADVFVARLDPRQTGAAQLQWCTMLAGIGSDCAFDLALSPDGNTIAVVGVTTSPNLPVTTNPFQTTLRGPADGFVLVLDGSTQRAGSINYLSYLGGDGHDWVNGVACDANGRLVLTGITHSPSFPVKAGAFSTSFNGATDTFVAVLDYRLPPGAQLIASTFLGGGGYEGVGFDLANAANMTIGDVAVAADRTILVCGRTTSTAPALFPTTPNAFQTAWAGGIGADMFVTRFDAALTTLRYSTYLGGLGDDAAMKLAPLPGTDVAIAGFTWSTGSSFPTTPGAWSSSRPTPGLAGATDGVLAVLRTAGQRSADLNYSTLLGGPSRDWLFALQVEDTGVLTAAGLSEGGFTGTIGAMQPLPQPPRDAWIVRLDPRGGGAADLHYATFLGGPGGSEEWAYSLALHGDGLLAVAGITDSSAFPTRGALQPVTNGALEAFVTVFDPLPARAQRHGTSSPGCRGPVWLQVNANPTPGNAAFQLLGNGAPHALPGALVVGPALPGLRYLNIDLLVAPVVVLPIASDAHGGWRMALPLPVGLPPGPSVFVQAVWLEAGCAAGPLSASHALGF